MSDPTTVNRGYAIPARGSDVGTWDVPLNGDFNLIDQNLGAISTVAVSNVSVTLSPSQYACGTIILSGVLTASISVSWPAVQGWWTVSNQTTGNFYIQLVCGAGRRVCVDQGSTWDIQMDGTNAIYRNFPAVGTYLDIADATLPLWVSGCTGALPYLNCDGSSFSGGTYPVLAQKLGGTTLPDLRGVSRATLNQGTSRITSAGSGINGDARFSRGGSETITLSAAQLPAISSNGTISVTSNQHLIPSNTVQLGTTTGVGGSQWGIVGPSNGSQPATIGDITSSGFNTLNSSNTGGLAHSNMPPTTISGITLIRAG